MCGERSENGFHQLHDKSTSVCHVFVLAGPVIFPLLAFSPPLFIMNSANEAKIKSNEDNDLYAPAILLLQRSVLGEHQFIHSPIHPPPHTLHYFEANL